MDVADYTSGGHQLDELRPDLRRFAAWLTGEGFASSTGRGPSHPVGS